MDLQTTFTIILLMATLVVMSGQWLRVDLIALLVMLLLILSGILSPTAAFSAFGQPVIIIIASIYILGAALYETGVATIIGNQILRFGGRGEGLLMLVIMLIAGLMTSFLGGFLVVSLLMPAVLRVARRTGIAPSRLLLPLATMATVGNQLTLIGTPGNLVVSDILAVSGYGPLGLFALTPYGLASAGIVILWYLLPGRRFLRRAFPTKPELPSLDEVQQHYELDKLLYRMRVRTASNLVATTLADSDLSTTAGLNLIAVRSKRGKLRPASAEWVLEQDDLLIGTGDYARILQAAGRHGLEIKGSAHLSDFNRLEQETLRLAEVIVPIRSSLVGQSLAAIDFRGRYGLNILAVQRQGKAIHKKLPELILAAGDTLLVQGPHERIRKVGEDLNLVSVTDLSPRPGELVTGKAALTLLTLGLMLIVVVSGLLSLATASLVAAVTLILAKCISLERAYQSIDAKLIVLVGGMLSLAAALEQTGAAQVIAGIIVYLSRDTGPVGALLVLYLLTTLITQVIANSVVAALMMPIAINLAVAQGSAPQAFAIAIAFAVNSAYITPLTDGDNLLVREPGQYTMRDYLIHGTPIFLLQSATIIIMLILLFGLNV
jgi:di/tricarboxylate transporter